MCVPVTELRLLAKHLNQLCIVDTVGVVRVWLIHLRVLSVAQSHRLAHGCIK